MDDIAMANLRLTFLTGFPVVYVIMAHIVMAFSPGFLSYIYHCTGFPVVHIIMAHIFMAYVFMAYIVMPCIVLANIGIACTVVAYIVMDNL